MHGCGTSDEDDTMNTVGPFVGKFDEPRIMATYGESSVFIATAVACGLAVPAIPFVRK